MWRMAFNEIWNTNTIANKPKHIVTRECDHTFLFMAYNFLYAKNYHGKFNWKFVRCWQQFVKQLICETEEIWNRNNNENMACVCVPFIISHLSSSHFSLTLNKSTTISNSNVVSDSDWKWLERFFERARKTSQILINNKYAVSFFAFTSFNINFVLNNVNKHRSPLDKGHVGIAERGCHHLFKMNTICCFYYYWLIKSTLKVHWKWIHMN